jgi:hypothetical protein
MFCTACQWDPLLATGPSHFADEFLGLCPMFQPEVLSPRESSIHPEPPLLHLGMSSYLQIAPPQHEIESRAAGDAVKGGNPAGDAKRTSSPPRITNMVRQRIVRSIGKTEWANSQMAPSTNSAEHLYPHFDHGTKSGLREEFPRSIWPEISARRQDGLRSHNNFKKMSSRSSYLSVGSSSLVLV